MSSLQVQFKNSEYMTIRDIIDFEDEQQNEIKAIAKDYTMDELRKVKRYGVDLTYLTDNQKKHIIYTKDIALSFKTSEQIHREKVIKFGEHSLEQILKRRGSKDKNVIINIIERFIRTNCVDKAQFKGYPNLSYTLSEIGDPDEYGFASAFFFKKREKRIKMITVFLDDNSPYSNEENEKTEYRIAEVNKDYYKELMRLKEHLKKKNFRGRS